MVLPVLLLLIVGMMQFGLLFHEYLLVTHAAREGARVATLGGSDAEIVATVNAAAASPSDTEIVPAIRVRGAQVTITVTKHVPLITPLFSAIFPQNPVPVSGTSIMQVE
jgi:Flp pilus assembly protein TadG